MSFFAGVKVNNLSNTSFCSIRTLGVNGETMGISFINVNFCGKFHVRGTVGVRDPFRPGLLGIGRLYGAACAPTRVSSYGGGTRILCTVTCSTRRGLCGGGVGCWAGKGLPLERVFDFVFSGFASPLALPVRPLCR